MPLFLLPFDVNAVSRPPAVKQNLRGTDKKMSQAVSCHFGPILTARFLFLTSSEVTLRCCFSSMRVKINRAELYVDCHSSKINKQKDREDKDTARDFFFLK